MALERMKTMPAPEPGRFFVEPFDGTGIEVFLARYNRVGDMYEASSKSRCGMLEFWVSPSVREYLTGVEEFLKLEWDALQAHLKDVFEDGITEGSQYTVLKLKQYVQEKGETKNLQQFHAYYTGYMAQARSLKERNLLTDVDLAGYFVGGLELRCRRDILDRVQAARLKPASSDSKGAEATVQMEVSKVNPPTLAEIRREGVLYFKKDDFFSEQIDDVRGVGAEENRDDRYKLRLKKKKDGEEAAGVPENKDEVASLTKQMQELRIMFTRFATSSTAQGTNTNSYAPRALAEARLSPASGTNTTPIGGGAPSMEPRPCFYDGAVSACMARGKMSCEALRADQVKGLVQLGNDPRKTLLFPDGSVIPFNPGRMVEAVRQRAEAAGAVSSNVIQWNNWTEPEVGTTNRTYVVAADGEAKENDDWYFESDNGEKRGFEQDEEEPVQRKRQDTRDQRVHFVDDDTAMDAEGPVVQKKRGERVVRKPATQLWAPIDSDETIDLLTDAILDNHITIPSKALLSLSKDLGDALAGKIKKRRVPVPTTTPRIVKSTATPSTGAQPDAPGQPSGSMRVSAANLEGDSFESEDSLLYSQPLGALNISIGGVPCKMLIDPGSEVNLISSGFLDRSGLQLAQKLLDPSKHSITGVGGHNQAVTAVCEKVLIQCGPFENQGHFFVTARSGPNEILAGMPFLRTCRAHLYFKQGKMLGDFTSVDGDVYQISLNNPQDFINTAAVGPEGWKRKVNEHYLRHDRFGHRELSASTAYKPVGVKVRPVAAPLPDKYCTPRYFRPELPCDPFSLKPALDFSPLSYTDRLSEERLKELDFGPEGFINDIEKQFLVSILLRYQDAIAFDRSEKGCLRPEYATDYEIPVISHEPWVDRAIPIPKALLPQVTELLRKEIEAGDLEPSFSPYATRWFTVVKKNGSLRKVVDASSMNRITIRDTGVPPNVSDFVQDFVGHATYALADLFSGYDERTLHVNSRDMTTIRTPLGTFRHTKLLQGATNSVAEFQRSISWVYQDEIPTLLRPFLDDVAMKGAASFYDNELQDDRFPIRRFVYEHGVKLERLLFRTQHAGLTVSGPKFIVITPALAIVGHVTTLDGVQMSRRALNKIATWKLPCRNVKELRAFLGTVGAVRLFVAKFAEHDAPLRSLLVKGRAFTWTDVHTKAAENLLAEVGTDRMLVKLRYDVPNLIILAVDSSNIAAGIAPYQEDDTGNRRPARFDSVPFTEVESRYSQPKLELCGVFKALKRMRLYLYGRFFRLEVDAKSLIQMFNNPELPSSPMNRWLAFLKLFDLEIVHVPAKQHELVDGLSRGYFEPDGDIIVSDDEDYREIRSVNVHALVSESADSAAAMNGSEDPVAVLPVIEDGTSEDWQNLIRYLTSGLMPDHLAYEARRTLRNRSKRFFVKHGKLWKRQQSGLHQQVVFGTEQQEDIIRKFHEASHRGLSAVHSAVSQRYWWPRFGETLERVIRSCDKCQRRGRDHPRPREPLHPTLDTSRLFQKVSIDVVHMGAGCGSYRYLILARDDLSGWVEGRALRTVTSQFVMAFFGEQILSRYGPMLDVIVNDNGKEFLGTFAEWIERLELDHRLSTPYNPQGHGAIERGHPPIFEALCKISAGIHNRWNTYLHAVLYADRVTTKRTTGYSPFELVFGALPCLPLDQDLETWVFTDWKRSMTTAELLYQRTRQIIRNEKSLRIAGARLAEARKTSASYMDKRMAHRIREPLLPGDLVLVHDTALAMNFTKKMENRWYGPFKIISQQAKGSYFIAELDGTKRRVPIAPHRLRKYFLSAQTNLDNLPAELLMPVSLRAD